MIQQKRQPWNFQQITTGKSSQQPRQRAQRPTWKAFANGLVFLLMLQLIGVVFVSLKFESSLLKVSDNLVFLSEELWDYTLLHQAIARAEGDDVFAAVAAAQAEEDSNDDVALSIAANDSSLDDFYSRRHFLADHQAPFLIVGGSDGSGTRAVVKTLLQLGVNFIIEDKGTMDVHGQEMFRRQGWPALVNLIMNHTHSANFELSSLPQEVVDQAIVELKKFKAGLERRGRRRYNGVTLRGSPTAVAPKDDRPAQGIKDAWKAPVSMLLLPLLREFFGPVKFLHVVRDGRDVSLSDNQSPVNKFYNTFYNITASNDDNRSKDQITISAMRLWNDWNVQVMKWGKEHSDGETFDYHIVRTEDLMDPGHKFASLVQLAAFVGANRSIEELCCLSQQTIVDLGKSDRTMGRQKRAQRDPRNYPGLSAFLSTREGRGAYARAFAEENGAFAENNRAEELLKKLAAHSGAGESSRAYLKQQAKIFRDRRDQMLRLHRAGMQPNRRYLQERYSQLQQRHTSLMEQFHYEVSNDEEQDEETVNEEDTMEQDTEPQDKSRRLSIADKRMPAADAHETGLAAMRHRAGRLVRKRAAEPPEKVMARYGKWVNLLMNRTDLSGHLHEIGAEGLEAFGYEPRIPFMDPPSSDLLQHCQEFIRKKFCAI